MAENILPDSKVPWAKSDHDKPRMGLVMGGFIRALTAVSLVGTFGADEYTDDGWVHAPDGIERYTDAMYLHLAAEHLGECVVSPDVEEER
ncbi:MAG: dATP/dGTP diphosphohydrolase domain-containing protein [Microcoleus sp.]